MEEELDYLLDDNIHEIEVSDVIDKNGKSTVGISFMVGLKDEHVIRLIELVGEDAIKQIPLGFELLFTKKDINKMLKILKEY